MQELCILYWLLLRALANALPTTKDGGFLVVLWPSGVETSGGYCLWPSVCEHTNQPQPQLLGSAVNKAQHLCLAF